jgi:NAD(P)-dependent dehydrogenase (short-subunit alcohol dehydrogenase family)
MTKRFEGKTVIVTGGGSGIGHATALQFAREGARVLVADIDSNAAARVVHEIESTGSLASAIVADVSTDEGAKAISARALELGKGIDVLVNNAASFHYKRVEDATRADWERVLGVNVIGTSLCSKYAVEAMKRGGGGAIVNVASINGLIAMPNWMTYNASKAAVIEMSKSMAMDLAPFNIRVNCVCPGVTHTPALDRAIADLGMTAQQVIDAVIAPRCLIKRFGRPEEVAPMIVMLASHEASYMTGATVVVDGGFSA